MRTKARQSRSGETLPRPPFLIRWALRLLLSGDERGAILNELDELYERRSARDGVGFVLARLEPTTDLARAADELKTINRRIFPIWQSSYQDESASWGLMDLKEVVVGDVGVTLAIVFGAVGFVLVLPCGRSDRYGPDPAEV